MASTLILGAGEIAVASIPSGDDTGLTPPAIGVKIGDGSKTFAQLGWIQATAGDVYGWAKAPTRPEYKAEDIVGLAEYISGEIQDTNTTYQLVKIDEYNYKLQSKDINGEWVDVKDSAFEIPKYDDTEVRGLITGIKDGATIDSFADVEAALAGKQATGDYALNSAVNDVADRVTIIEGDYLKAADKTELNGKIGTAQSAAEAAQGDVGKLETYVGTFTPVGEETTVVGYIDAKIGAIPEQTDYSVTVEESSPEGYAKAYTFKQLGSELAVINIPKDMVVESGSVVTNPEGQAEGTYIKLVLANANEDELFINVGDLIEYVTGGTAADGMITINVDADHVATATINDGTVTLAKLHVDIQTAIGKAHTHANADVLNGITEEKVAAWDAAQVNVIDGVSEEFTISEDGKVLNVKAVSKDKITGLADALAGKVDVVEGSRLITDKEAEKLEKLVLGEDGSVEVSGTIAAGNVDGLDAWITARAGTLEGLSENNFDDALLAKLNGVAEGAQVNVIDGVSEEFVISADGKVLSVKAIAQEKITGLADALAGKVDVVEGKGLSTNDFTDALLTKLNGIAEGAEVNYIKSVTSEFAVSDAGELSVGSINVSKLVQTEGEVLVLDAGTSV